MDPQQHTTQRFDCHLSVVVPCYNEQGNIVPLYQKLSDAIQCVRKSEIIFVDDGSSDETLAMIKDLSTRDPRVRFISFSRNFGHQAAIKAGIDASSGDCLVMLDADLQHPPDLIPAMLDQWKAGHKIVYTKRSNNKGYSFAKRQTAKLFYKLMAKISRVHIAEDSADFRLIDRQVINVIRPIRDNFLFLRGLLPWMGFSSTTLCFDVQPRFAGKTKYSLIKMLSFALTGITSFSTRPLRLASLLGITISFLAFIYAMYAIYVKLFTDLSIPGWTSVLVAVLFIGGIQLIMIGIIGEYLGKLFVQHKDRPQYIVKDSNT